MNSSALTQHNLKHVFDTAVRAVINPKAIKEPAPIPPKKPEPPVVSPIAFTDARFASLVNNKQFSDVTFRVQDKYVIGLSLLKFRWDFTQYN